MLKALGARLQHLSATYSADTPSPHGPIPGNNLSPYMLRHCPLLTHVSLKDLRPSQPAKVRWILGCQAPIYCNGTLVSLLLCRFISHFLGCRKGSVRQSNIALKCICHVQHARR
jgi:hypothetical protein